MRLRGTVARVEGRLLVTELETAKSRRCVAISEPVARLLSDPSAAQAGERRDGGPAWQGTGFVFTTDFGRRAASAIPSEHLTVAGAGDGLPETGLDSRTMLRSPLL